MLFVHATKRYETLHEIVQPIQDEIFLGTYRPLSPTTAFGVKPGISLLISTERQLCQLVESRDMAEDGGDEVRDFDSKVWEEFFSQRIIDLPPVLGCVCEAARVERSRRLLKRECK